MNGLTLRNDISRIRIGRVYSLLVKARLLIVGRYRGNLGNRADDQQ